MADSLRLAVLKQLTEYLEQRVTPAHGATNNLTGAVFRGRFWVSAKEDPLPMLSILEALNPDREPNRAGAAQTTQKDGWILLLQGWVKDDPDNPTDPAHGLMAEVKQALAELAIQIIEERLRGTPMGNVQFLRIEPGTVRPPDELSERAFFWLRISIELAEDLENPFWTP